MHCMLPEREEEGELVSELSLAFSVHSSGYFRDGLHSQSL